MSHELVLHFRDGEIARFTAPENNMAAVLNALHSGNLLELQGEHGQVRVQFTDLHRYEVNPPLPVES